MKFNSGDICEIVATGCDLDGIFVEVIGVASDIGELPGNIYIIRRTDGGTFNVHGGKWKATTLTDACLRKAKWNGE